MIKVFGVGNILLCDEGVGVKVVKEIKDKIKDLRDDIEVFIGETDALYCINKIRESDKVIIIDSTYFMTRPGEVTVRSIDKCDQFINYEHSAHEESFLSILRKERRDISGYLIGIEIENIDYNLELSKTIQKKFNQICKRVYEEIADIVA